MQVSVETTSSVERKMTIGVPAEQVDQEVEKRIQQTAKTIKLNGFRPGKVPVKVVRKRYGMAVRQEVLNEVMRDSYMNALTQEGINPIGYPKFEPNNIEAGADVEFTATFEVAPEPEQPDLSQISIEEPSAEIKAKDIKEMIDVLRRQHGEKKAVKRKCKKKDILTIDYTGYVNDEAFEGGSGKNHPITLGEGKMIPGFEEGLVGAKAGEDVELNLAFPEDYFNEELAGKDARFEVSISQVEEIKLPEMNEEFYAKYGIETDSEETFQEEVTKNMQRELTQAIQANVKQQIVDGLLELSDLEVPQAMVDQEITKMKHDAIRQFGGGQNMDPNTLPSEMFQAQAESRVKTGLLFAAVMKANDIKPDGDKVTAKIEELAATYESPDEVKAFYAQPENKAQIEAAVLEDEVVSVVLAQAKVKKKKMSYEDAVKPPVPKQAEAKD